MALLLTKCGQRARAEAVSHGSLGGGVAVEEKHEGELALAMATVELLRWRRSSEDELSSAMAPAALGAGTAVAMGEEEGRGEANGELG